MNVALRQFLQNFGIEPNITVSTKLYETVLKVAQKWYSKQFRDWLYGCFTPPDFRDTPDNSDTNLSRHEYKFCPGGTWEELEKNFEALKASYTKKKSRKGKVNGSM